jgi:uncharacterized protein YqjF (DUF2071 family)
MLQNWGKLLFMHWPVSQKSLRPLIPESLTIDTFDGTAWIGITAFTLWDVRVIYGPPLPWISDFHELNVRTYVHSNGVPGVWFFSLDANSRIAVRGARLLYHLPYFNASIDLEEQEGTIYYNLKRRDKPPAQFSASWRAGSNLPEAEPGTLEFFLVERYCLYAASGKHIYRGRIYHRPWPLQEAELLSYQSTMIESHGLPTPEGDPLLHYADTLEVEVWSLESVE